MMFMTLLAPVFVAALQSPAPLTLQQQTTVRCAAAFALVAEGQANGNDAALKHPELGTRGKEFFVRALAQLMDETGMDRAAISALMSAESQRLWDEDGVDEVMPGCLLLLDASGI